MPARTRSLLACGLAVAATAATMTIAPAFAYDRGGDSDDRGSFGDNLKVIGLAGDRTLVTFDTDRPDEARRAGDVKGLALADQVLVGIDYRVQDGKLYAVGRGGGVYSVDPSTQQATSFAQLSVALEGQNFGVDFNPAANALRVISNTGQNLRQPFAVAGTATVVDALLTTPPTAGTTTGVNGAAYTNNDLDTATATTLYDLGTNTNQVLLQSPANAGTLAPTGTTPVDLAGDTGFDIYSKIRNGRTVELFPYAVNAGRLYDVELFNGQLKDAGRIGDGRFAVTDLAIPLNQL